MSVINAMVFGNNNACMVADEAATAQAKPYNIAEKIRAIRSDKLKVLLGGVGHGSVLFECNEQFQKQLETRESLRAAECTNLLKGVMHQVKYNLIDDYVQAQMGISYREFQAGYLNTDDRSGMGINQNLQARFFNLLEGRELGDLLNNLAISIVAADSDGMQMHTIDLNQGTRMDYSLPYVSLEPGSKASYDALYDFVGSLPREKRHDIDQVEGIKALVYATWRSTVENIYVGGVPDIYLLQTEGDEPFKRIEKHDSLLLTEIVRASRHGFISEYQATGLYELIISGNDFDNSQRRFLESAGDRSRDLQLFLRGYDI